MEAESVSYITEEEDQEPVTIPVIKTEPYVNCVSVESVKDICYRLYPKLPAPISVCPCETRICLREFDIQQL